MAHATLARAEHDVPFREFLIGTGQRAIVEHHVEGCDARWGAEGNPTATGWNLQGRILMAIRNIIARDPLHIEEDVE